MKNQEINKQVKEKIWVSPDKAGEVYSINERARLFIHADLHIIISEFFSQDWEKLPRIIELSGLTEKEISALPKNSLTSRFFTAVMRSWQKEGRSRLMLPGKERKDREATVIAQEDEILASQEQQDIFSSRVANLLTDTQTEFNPFTFFDRGGKSLAERIFLFLPDGRMRLFIQMLDDMVNPFDIDGKKIYVTEYAQMVNLMARQLQSEGLLRKQDVLKLTFLAALQFPAGIVVEGKWVPPKQFYQGKQVPGENDSIAVLYNPLFPFNVPLTRERMSNKKFLKSIKWKDLLRTPMMKMQFRNFIDAMVTSINLGIPTFALESAHQ